MTRARAEWWDKANALAAAWRDVFGADLAPAGVALALAVAEHETRCGDAWAGHNWGACTKGALTAAQRTALIVANVYPALPPRGTPNASEWLAALDVRATKALAAAGCPVPDDAEIHVDSSPATGAYFTLFGRFASDVEGARYFVHVLAETRSTCRQILEQAHKLADGGASELAGAMYRSHYYTGFHDPSQLGGADLNVRDYASAIAAGLGGIKAALVGWTPGADPPVYTEPATIDPSTPLGLQQALNRLGAAPALVEDGIIGPKTEAALGAFQATQGVYVSKRADAMTLTYLRAALA